MPPLPKTCPKTVCPRKGVAFLWKAFLQKNFQVREKIPLSALAFGSSHALVAEGFKEPSAMGLCRRRRLDRARLDGDRGDALGQEGAAGSAGLPPHLSALT